MNKRKGFTLTEILVVIVIIGVIMSIAIPASIMISNSIKERTYQAKMTTYVTAAEQYAKNNKTAFGTESVIQISVETLLAYGYVDEDYSCGRVYGCVEDPRNKGSIMNDEPITLKINKNIIQALAGPMEVELSLNFSSNGASSIGATAVGCQTLNGSSCAVILPTITRDGYTILGWSKTSSATTGTYSPGETVDIYENGNYYAITSKNVNITFNKNTASSISASSAICTMYNTQTSCSVTMPTITPNSGYSVIGWNTSSGATTKLYDASQTITVSSNNTYYAITKLITYTCHKTVASTSCSYTSTDSTISACQSSGYTNCVANGCASDLWTYFYQFTVEDTSGYYWGCRVQGRTSVNLAKTCTLGNIKEILLTGSDGIQDLDFQYCLRNPDGIQKTLYYSTSSSSSIALINLSLPNSPSCQDVWARSEGGYTRWDYSGDSYLYGQTSCPDGYTATLE